MKDRHYQTSIVFAGLLLTVILAGCSGPRHASVAQDREALAQYSRPGLQYNLYLLPEDSATARGKKAAPYARFSIRVINTADNASPLRRLCHNLDEYNTYYEYLLNRALNDLQLIDNGAILYPVSYSFENNYNAFPFETINVGYRIDLRQARKKKHALKMVYADRVFAQDTIVFNLNHTNL